MQAWGNVILLIYVSFKTSYLIHCGMLHFWAEKWLVVSTFLTEKMKKWLKAFRPVAVFWRTGNIVGLLGILLRAEQGLFFYLSPSRQGGFFNYPEPDVRECLGDTHTTACSPARVVSHSKSWSRPSPVGRECGTSHRWLSLLPRA